MASSSVVAANGMQSVSPSLSNGNRAGRLFVSSPSLNTISSASTPGDAHLNNCVVEQSELTSASSPDCRIPGQPIVPPSPTLNRNTPPSVEISVPNSNNYYVSRQDVHSVVNTSASVKSSSTVPRISYPATPLETPVSSFPDSFQHDSLNQQSHRPRTTQVFSTHQDLAAHYGIPTILPPAPRTTPRRSQPSPVQQGYNPHDFASQCSNYLSMLAQKPEDNTTPIDTTSGMNTVNPMELTPAQPSTQEAVQNLLDALLGEYTHVPSLVSDDVTHRDAAATPHPSPDMLPTSPEFTSPNEFLTSPWTPFDDSPFEDCLTTPLIPDSSDMDLLTGPLIDSYGDNLSLFGGIDTASPLPTESSQPTKINDMENLYTMSPTTPSLDSVDPTSLYPSPRLPSTHPAQSTPASTSTRRRNLATGTRKNITPESLVPIDAPTQPRKYLTPSVTSRKDVPAVFARKRARSQALGDEEDELKEEAPGPTASEREQIEWKRRQNTLAARKSRKRKLMHQQYLEEQVDQLTKERDKWRTRAQMLMNLLHSHGIPCKQFED